VDAQPAVFRGKRGENLLNLSVHLERYDALPVRIERGDGRCLISEGALERARRLRREPHEKIPERRHEGALEQHRAGNRRGGQQRAAEKWARDQTRGAKSESEAEQESRRCNGPEYAARGTTRSVRYRVVRVSGGGVLDRMHLCRPVAMSQLGVSRVAMTEMGMASVPVSAARMTVAPETAQRHGRQARGAQQQTRDVEVHRKERV
jgi:hypothetical protein